MKSGDDNIVKPHTIMPLDDYTVKKKSIVASN